MLTTRPDGTKVQNLSTTRALMPLLMKGRAESTVYFEQELDVTETQRFVDTYNVHTSGEKLSLFHIFLWALAGTLHARPRLNRFVSGGRIWQRNGVHLSFAAKAKKLDDNAALVTIKREFATGASIAEVANAMHGAIKLGRSGVMRPEDKEVALTAKLPLFVVKLALRFIRWANEWNLLPMSAIAHDPLFTSAFVANLGSVGLEAAYHHLYEWGNCPFFAALGKTRQVNGRLKVLVRWSFDERIDDGLSCAHALAMVRDRVEAPLRFDPDALPSIARAS